MPKLKLLTFPGRPKSLAKRLRRIARYFRDENNVRYFSVVALNMDGTTEVFSHGYASFIEKLGILDIAKDSLLHPEE